MKYFSSFKNLVYVLVLVACGCRGMESAVVDIKHPPLAFFVFQHIAIPELKGGVVKSLNSELARYRVRSESGNAYLVRITLRLIVNSGDTRRYIDGLAIKLDNSIVATSGPVLGAQEQAPKTATDQNDATMEIQSGLIAREATMSVIGLGPGTVARGDRVQITLVEVKARSGDDEQSTIPVGLKSYSLAYQ